MNKNFFFLLLLVVAGNTFAAKGPIYNVMDYGAVSDGKTLTTKALQKTIDECAANGGGRVDFPAGKYLTGTLYLKSYTELHFHAGSELMGSGNLADYPSTPSPLPSFTDNYTEKSLIYAARLQNVSITGQGKINGQGFLFRPLHAPYKVRPYLIRMIECKDINIRDITLQNPAMWTQHYLACEDLTVDNIKVDSWNSNTNGDGIDIDGCDRVMISNSYFKAEDDAIVLKSDLPRPCRNVTVTNCILSSLCNGFKCGTESVGGFENITVSNCVILNTRLSGIAIEMVDGGYMNNVNVSNIVMTEVNNPIFVRLGDRGRPYMKGEPIKPAGTMKNIRISNVTATGTGNFTADKYPETYQQLKVQMRNPEIGCPISGVPGHDIDNISLSNINISFKGGGTAFKGPSVPEKETGYPEYNMFGNLPAYGFFIRHVKGLIMENINLSYELADVRPAVYLKHVTDARFSGFKAASENDTEALIAVDSSSNIVIRDSEVFGKKVTLATIKQGSSNIGLINNFISKDALLFKSENSIKKTEITVK